MTNPTPHGQVPEALIYAELPDLDDTLWLAIGQHRRAITIVETSAAAKAVDAAVHSLLRAYADATHAIRASHGQAPAGAAPATQQAGEVVAELSVDRFTTQLLALPASHDVRPYGLHKLYTAPQPAQAQAGAVPMYRLLQSGVDRIEAADEFLSDDATTWAIDPNGIFVGNIYGGHVLRPARRRIKGGQRLN